MNSESYYVFCAPDGSRLTHSVVKSIRSADLPESRPRKANHLTRSTPFASHLVMRGVALKAVQELLGHATIDMAMRYAHLSPHVNREAVTLLDLKGRANEHCRNMEANNEKSPEFFWA